MHLTLFFMGETERVQAVKETLAQVKAPPFELRISGVGRFPAGEKKAPRVLWVGFQEQPALDHLQRQIATALIPLGFQQEDRPFSPHVTLARLKTDRPLPEIAQFLKVNQEFQVRPVFISGFVLYSSTLTPQGSSYRHEAVYTLEV